MDKTLKLDTKLGLDCLDVASQYQSNKKHRASPIMISGCTLHTQGLYHGIASNDKQIQTLCELTDRRTVFCSINHDVPIQSEQAFSFAHMDAFAMFVGATQRDVDNYVVFFARSLIDVEELTHPAVTKRSGIIKHTKHLKQLADFYDVRIVLINELTANQIYLDDVIKTIEEDRFYLS